MLITRIFTTIAIVVITALFSPGILGRPVPQNLANGLDKIVENHLIEQGQITAPPQVSTAGKNASGANAPMSMAAYRAAVAKDAAIYSSNALIDRATGKYLVDIMPNGRVPVETLKSSLEATFPGIKVQATETRYAGHGLVEAYVTLDDVAAIAQTKGVSSVVLQ